MKRTEGFAALPGKASRSQTPVRRFLGLWHNGLRPDLEAFVRQHERLEAGDLAAILRADQRKRWRTGMRVPAEWYFERFPIVSDDPDVGLDLIHGEFVLRESLGEALISKSTWPDFRVWPNRSRCKWRSIAHSMLWPGDRTLAAQQRDRDASVNPRQPRLQAPQSNCRAE